MREKRFILIGLLKAVEVLFMFWKIFHLYAHHWIIYLNCYPDFRLVIILYLHLLNYIPIQYTLLLLLLVMKQRPDALIMVWPQVGLRIKSPVKMAIKKLCPHLFVV